MRLGISAEDERVGAKKLGNAGTSIACISAQNDNTSLNRLLGIGAATFEAETSIGDISVHVDNAP